MHSVAFTFAIYPFQPARTMWSASQLSFAVIVAGFTCMQSVISSPMFQYNINNTLGSYLGSINNTKCHWNCTVIDSDFPEQWKKAIGKKRLITLVVDFEKKVNKKCVQHTSESSGNATEYFKIWLPTNNQLSGSFDHAIQHVFNSIFSGQTDEQASMKAACNLGMATELIAFSTITNDLLSPLVRSHVAYYSGVKTANRGDRSTGEMPNSVATVTRSNSTRNNTNNHFTEKLGFTFLIFGYCVILMYYYPAFICVFYPTRVTESGLRQIVLERTSPVSFTSFVANFFHSENETIWHKTKMLILRLVVFPLPFIAPAALVFYSITQTNKSIIPYWFRQDFTIVFLVSYVVQSIYESFFKIQSRNVKPCRVCRLLKPKFECNTNLPRKILNHLRLQPLIVVKSWSLFKKCIVWYFEMSCLVLPSQEVTAVLRFLRIGWFLVLFTLIPVVTVIVLSAVTVVAVFAFFSVTPITFLCDTFRERAQGLGFSRLAVTLLVLTFITVPALLGTTLVLLYAAVGVAFGIAAVLVLLLSEESLPFVVLVVLVCYYLWCSYSSFTTKYHDLSLTLFKCYQQNRHHQNPGVASVIITNDPEQAESTNSPPESGGNVIKIPEELFDMACEELMPVREGVCVLIVKVVSILSCVLGVFFLIMQLDASAAPVMKAVITFFTGSLPKIITISMDGGRKKRLNEMVIEEKALKIVQDYIKHSSGAAEESEAYTEVILMD